MKTALNAVVTCVLAIFGRMFFFGPASGSNSGSSSAGTASQGTGFAEAHIAPLMARLTGAHLSSQDMALITGGAFVYATVLGFVSRAVLGDRLLDFRLNGFVALLGSWGALLLYAALFERATADDFAAVAAFVGVGSLLALAAAGVLKAFVLREAETFMTGGQSRIVAAMKRFAANSSGRGAPGDRLHAGIKPDQR